jgi:rifampicin phosphotransferase
MFIVDAKTGDQNSLGGKALALAHLAQADLPIPAWFVLAPIAFHHCLDEFQKQQLAQGDTAVFDAVILSQAVQEQLAIALKKLCPDHQPVAVRSSALDEDGAVYSFAGQLDSFLEVPLDQVAEKIVAVWRSGFSDRIIAYRHEHHLPPPQPPAVLIQRMVQADLAGVAFSANPITGQRGMAVVSAIAGLGAALVSGEADGETFWVDRSGQVMPINQMQKNAFEIKQIQSVATMARTIARHFGRPQDIEWAIANDQLYLLQARPITALQQMADPDGILNLWDNSNIAESYGGITTPLTFSFARRAYEAVYRQFCKIMGVSASAIAQNDATFYRMLGLVRGRIYYNLLNWYRLLALLPGFQINRAFMEQMMGVQEELPADVLATLENTCWQDKLRDSGRLVRTIAGLIKNHFTLPQQIKRFYQRLDQALGQNAPLETMRPDELAAYYLDLERQLLTRWDAPLVNDFFAMIFYGILRKLTAKWCGDIAGTLQNNLVSGEGGMISAEPARRVQEMAKTVIPYPNFIHTLCESSLAEILPDIPHYPQFATQFQAYLQKFGDRCLEELKLESTTLHDDPLLLLRSIGQLAQGTPFRSKPAPINLRSQAEEQVTQSLKHHPLRQLIFNWVLQNARSRVRDRENLRFERTRVFGRVRQICVELGKQFHAMDLLDTPRDIFYLELNEILGFIDGTTTCTDLRGIAALRQKEFAGYQKLDSAGDLCGICEAARFQTHGMVHPIVRQLNWSKPSPAADSTSQIQGIGCCPGIVRARVQVITDPRQATLQSGCILVAERTDPGWIMLFPAAAGLLVERGSLLSHSAIVAREMGIPAIVSIPHITQVLKTDDWVEMNGSTGLIKRITPPVPQTVNSHA